MADDRTYIRVHDGMDEHPKVEPLSDAAFRLLMTNWFYCSRNKTDGRITDAAWKRRGSARARRELLDVGLAHQRDGHVEMHDYLDWQRSASEIEEIKAGRGAGGSLGNHVRWHVKRRINDPGCEHCNPHPSIAPSSQERSDRESRSESQTDRSRSHSQRQRQRATGYEDQGGHVPNAHDTPPRYADHCSKHADIAVPGKCGDCADARKAAQQRPPLALVGPQNPARKPHCGRCDETRHLATPVGVIRCPNCHPLAHQETA